MFVNVFAYNFLKKIAQTMFMGMNEVNVTFQFLSQEMIVKGHVNGNGRPARKMNCVGPVRPLFEIRFTFPLLTFRYVPRCYFGFTTGRIMELACTVCS